MRYRLRTLMIVLALGSVVVLSAVSLGDENWSSTRSGCVPPIIDCESLQRPLPLLRAFENGGAGRPNLVALGK